jgi:hypothetical protein
MAKKIKSTKALKEMLVPDFLPSPRELAESEKKIKVTILLGLESVNFF